MIRSRQGSIAANSAQVSGAASCSNRAENTKDAAVIRMSVMGGYLTPD